MSENLSSLLYLVEGPAQPDKFGSIPRALWWATAALTTIGLHSAVALARRTF